MAFFDDLGKKVGGLTQTAVKKSSNMVEISKLNSSISNEEKQINALYYEIGKTFYATYGTSPDVDGAFSSLCSQIKQHEINIQAFQEKIVEIKQSEETPIPAANVTQEAPPMPAPTVTQGNAYRLCPGCGNQVETGHAFCDKCGTKIPVEAPVPEPAVEQDDNCEVCPGCGNLVEKTHTFCDKCGTKVVVVTPVPVVETPELTCPNCKSTIDDEMVFCMNCGTKVK